jgi:AAA domain
LIAKTIQEQDVIVCTLAVVAKVNLANNFRPVVTFLDEAARVPEAKSLIVAAMFLGATAHFLVGDHLQIGPYYASHRREKDTTNPFLNPFSP